MRTTLVVAMLVALALAGCAENAGTPTPSTNGGQNRTTGTPDGGAAPTPTSTPDGGATPTTPPAATTPPPTAAIACDAAAAAPAPAASWRAENPRVRLDTTMGDVVVALEMERAPITAGNFLNLTRSGFYDGVTFHRVIDGFVIQGGDPNSKDDDPSNDGGGGPGHTIPDEFNPTLRHDEAGILSMATAGPDTGGSQFFITLSATPGLDDRHAVFGRVVEGMDVVRAIGQTETGPGDRPVEDVVIQDAEVVEPAPFDATHAVGVHPVLARKPAEAGQPVTFAVVLKNQGSTRDAVALEADAPAGWTCSVNEAPTIPAGTGRVVFLTLTPSADATGAHDVAIRATSAWPDVAPAEEHVTVSITDLGEAVQMGDNVVANYAGFLPDGRLFDTSMAEVANDPDMPKFATSGGFRARPAYDPFDFQVGGGVIEGFTNLALTAQEGEIVTSRIPWQQAYAQGDMYQRPLTKRDLVFELEIVEIK